MPITPARYLKVSPETALANDVADLPHKLRVKRYDGRVVSKGASMFGFLSLLQALNDHPHSYPWAGRWAGSFQNGDDNCRSY
jgi:hypothetical protein